MPGQTRPSQTPEGVKARQLRLVEKAPKVECECGCGEMIPSIHRNGTKRRFHEGFRGPYRQRKPGDTRTHRGYVLEYAPDHPKAEAGWIRQHRLVWERHHGDPGELVIHHINGDKADNRIENLEAMTNGDHTAHHHQERKKAIDRRAYQLAASQGVTLRLGRRLAAEELEAAS